MFTTPLSLQDSLPLTCSRKGTCCHGNQVFINPWELHRLALEKQITPREFRDAHTLFGGIQLHFNGKEDHRGKQACSQYIDNFGCSVHAGRPLACRLFPIGRQIQNNEVRYIHQGKDFPCLNGCSEVLELPKLTLAEYLSGQETANFETAQDLYLEFMQDIADLAFELLLETDLAAIGATIILPHWIAMGNEAPETLAKRIGNDWLDWLMLPEISIETRNPQRFVEQHNELLQLKLEISFGNLENQEELKQGCLTLMGVALHLARAIGANPSVLAAHWCESAKGFLEAEN